jgi:hypothetical protein
MAKEKSQQTVKIFKVSGSIDKIGLRHKVVEFEAVETDKCYFFDSMRLNKEKIMVIDSIYRNDSAFISYHTYCLDGDQQKALDIIKEMIIDRVNTLKSQIDNLVNILEENKKRKS